MSTHWKSILASGAIAATLGVAGAAQAMPAAGDPAAGLAAQSSPVEQVRWVCGPYRCRWVPNYGIYGPRPYWGPRRHWREPRWGGPRWGGPRWDRRW